MTPLPNTRLWKWTQVTLSCQGSRGAKFLGMPGRSGPFGAETCEPSVASGTSETRFWVGVGFGQARVPTPGCVGPTLP